MRLRHIMLWLVAAAVLAATVWDVLAPTSKGPAALLLGAAISALASGVLYLLAG